MITEEVFLEAAKMGNLPCVLLYVEENRGNIATLNVTHEDSSTALIQAARYGHTEVVKALVKVEGINVNATSKFGETALIWAVKWGKLDVVNALLGAEGINVKIIDHFGQNALTAAKSYEHIKILNALLVALDPNQCFDTFSVGDFLRENDRNKRIKKMDRESYQNKFPQDNSLSKPERIARMEERLRIINLEKLFSHPNHIQLTQDRLQQLAYRLYEALPLYTHDTAKQKELAYKALSYFETIAHDHVDYPDAALAIYCIQVFFGEPAVEPDHLYKTLFTDRKRSPGEKVFEEMARHSAKIHKEIVQILQEYGQSSMLRGGFFERNAVRNHTEEVRKIVAHHFADLHQLLTALNAITITNVRDPLVQIRQQISWSLGVLAPLTIKEEQHNNDNERGTELTTTSSCHL